MTLDTEPDDNQSDRAAKRRPLFRRLITLAWWLFLLVLVLGAVAVAYARHLAATIGDHRPALEQLLSERLGQPVRLGELSARWQGPDPVIQANRVTLMRPERPEVVAAALQHLLLRLDGPRSLLRLGLVFERIEADGLDLVVARDEQGRFGLDGIPLPAPRTEDRPIDGLEQLFEPHRWLEELTDRISDPRIRLTHVTLGIKAPETEVLYVDIPQLDLVYDGDQVSASGRAMSQGTADQLATFALKGEDLLEGHFTGTIWAEFTAGGFFEGVTRGLAWRDFEIIDLEANARTWLTFDDGQLQRLNGRLSLPRFRVRNELETVPPVENLTAEIGWRRDGGGGSWHLRDLHFQWQDEVVSGLDTLIANNSEATHIRSAGVPIGVLSRLMLASGMLPARAQVELQNYRPEGILSAVHVTLPNGTLEDFELAATLDGVSVEPHQGVPGGSNLQGSVWLNQDGGRARTDGKQMTLHFPRLFAGPLTFQRASGEVGWRLEGGTARVFGTGLTADYGDTTHLEGSFDITLDRYGPDNLGLKIQLENGNVSILEAFLPVGVMDEGLHEWLTGSITGGTIVSGSFEGRGQIGDNLPEDAFSTAMEFRFREGRITYDPQWPEVTGASGRISIHNGNARVVVDEASTGGLQLDAGEVDVITGDGTAEVQVDTGATVNGERVAYWLRETPLGGMAGAAARTVTVGGDYRVDLGLTIPLDAARSFSVRASMATDNGEVHFPAAGPEWTDIQGNLAYSTSEGFTDDSLTARFLDHPVNITLAAEPEHRALAIRQTGQVEVESLARQLLPSGQPVPGLEGKLPYEARLEVRPDQAPRVLLTANTAGLWSEWPGPLTREAGIEESLTASLTWGTEDHLTLEGRWGERLGLALRWQEGDFDRGQVTVGFINARVPDDAGLVVSGRLDRFAPIAWQPWLDRLKALAAPAQTPSTPPSAGFYTPAWLDRIELSAEELLLGSQALPGVEAVIVPEDGGWLITTDSDLATGRIRIPAGGDVVWVDLARLQLARADKGSELEGEVNQEPTPVGQLEAFRSMGTEGWPDVDVRIESLVLGEDPAGAWSFVLSPQLEQVVLQDLQGRLGSLAFNGQMVWGITSGEEITSLQGVLEGGGLQDLAGLLGEELPLTNSKSNVDLDIRWPGSPDQMVAASLSGNITTRLEDGVILENNDTAQLFRVFNLLNTDTLRRRLRFDFSDLYEAGVAFDALYGKARLDNGTLTWDPDLQLAGPSGAFRLSGSTHLGEETLDMRLVVILPLTQNLPLAAILMGASPPIGGALFVLDKLLGEPLSKLTSATYSVKGTWENPDVDLRNIFDSGNQE